MSDPNSRISDDMVAEVLAEAARLHTEANKGYSIADLEQICLEAQIPPHIVRKAIRSVEEKRSREQAKRQQLSAYIKQQAKRGISVGIVLLIPMIAVSSIFIFRSQVESLVASLVARLNQQPAVILREDFRNRVTGKTKQEVIQAVGKPDSTSDSEEFYGDLSFWHYRNIKDPASGKVGSASVMFRDGVVDKVDFTTLY
ncbi:hypothetical protein IQ265_24045 [Nodosilinea sp. LEGE 06152]|uniref:hypothetical protein n=1 Tax=Nodosilinea sp. LEGE 06152 TaxID=2777966 RepID=UPI00187EAC76|nr:hypothetical protein [Nodosilinea sp. LEGE 06152]MBE9159881.1 hypothetical protein [Nodosilinea sp. LEGE 06152]